MLLSLLLACDVPPPQAPKPAAPANTCDLDVAKLGGTAWVYNKPLDSGGFEPDPTARLRFREEGGKVLADYTAGSSGSVYHYDCTLKGQIGTCLEHDPHADAFCHAYAAVHDGVCDPDAVAAATGIPVEEVKKVSDGVNAELKKLKKAEAEQQRKSDNSPNNKIRSKFNYAVDKKACGLTLQDKYQTMVDGKLNELENVIGAGKFVKADKEYTFESCEDPDSAWAPGPDDTHLAAQPAGTIKFSAIFQKKEQGGANCTYTADVYKDWVKSQEGLASTMDPKWGPRFDVSIPFTEKGRHVVYFDRTRTCGDKKDHIGLTCAMVRIE